MTGAFLRVERDGKWQNIEVEHMTDEEREKVFLSRNPDELLRWMNMLCHSLAEIEEAIEPLEVKEEK